MPIEYIESDKYEALWNSGDFDYTSVWVKKSEFRTLSDEEYEAWLEGNFEIKKPSLDAQVKAAALKAAVGEISSKEHSPLLEH